MSEPEANEQRQLSNLEKVTLYMREALRMFMQNAGNCGSTEIKGARNCEYVPIEKLACPVFHNVFSC